jgi:hypothetical protein
VRLIFRVADQLLRAVHSDLDRSHAFAGERVGFLTCGVGALAERGLGVYASSYHPVADDDYVPDHRAAAMLGPSAFRKILERVYNQPAAVFHVHRHDHAGQPSPSRIDESESRRFVPDFCKVCPKYPHGALILSLDSMSGLVWLPDSRKIAPFDIYTVVGDPLRIVRGSCRD